MKAKEESKVAYDLWRSINSPKTAIAPMVDMCDLPFRILCRKYGTELSYTQMYNCIHFTNSETFREKVYKEINEELDYPYIVQLSGHDPELLLKSAKYLQQKKVPYVDLNLGCPQMIAKHGHYGSFLLDHPDEVYKIVGYLCNNTKVPISCKIRLFNDLEKTYELCNKIEELGIKLLCVHGRTKEQNKDKVGACNWDAIKKIKELLSVPIIANGGIGTFDDIQKCFDYTKCDCVMSGEKLIEMPSFFSKKIYDIDDLAFEYLDLWKKYRPNDVEHNITIIKGHLFKFYFSACQSNPDFLQTIGKLNTWNECYELGKTIKEFRKDVKLEDKYTWYMRHRNKIKEDNNSFNTLIMTNDTNKEKIVENVLPEFFG